MSKIIENKIEIIERVYQGPKGNRFRSSDSFEIEIKENGETIYLEKMNNLLYRKSQSPPKLFIRWLFDAQIDKSQTTNNIGSNGCKCFEFIRKTWFKLFNFKK